MKNNNIKITGWGRAGYYNNKGIMTPKDKFIKSYDKETKLTRTKQVKYGEWGATSISSLIKNVVGNPKKD